MVTDDRQHVSTLETTIAILETLQRREKAGVTELASALDMSKGNVHKHLNTLCDHGFLDRDGTHYRFGLRFFEIGSSARRFRPLFHEATPRIRELAAVTNKTATLMIPNQNTGVYVHSIDPDDGTRPSLMQGERKRLHRTASGLAILSCFPETKCLELLPETLEDEEQNALIRRLQQIAEQGFAVDRLPETMEFREIAAPVRAKDGSPAGAVGLIINDVSETNKQVEYNYEKLVKKTSATLSKRLYLRQKSTES